MAITSKLDGINLMIDRSEGSYTIQGIMHSSTLHIPNVLNLSYSMMVSHLKMLRLFLRCSLVAFTAHHDSMFFQVNFIIFQNGFELLFLTIIEQHIVPRIFSSVFTSDSIYM